MGACVFAALCVFASLLLPSLAIQVLRTSSPSQFNTTASHSVFVFPGDYCAGVVITPASNATWIPSVLTVSNFNPSNVSWSLAAYGPAVACTLQTDCGVPYFSQGVPMPNIIADPAYVAQGSHPYLLTQCLNSTCQLSMFQLENGSTIVYNISVNQPLEVANSLATDTFSFTADAPGSLSFSGCDTVIPGATQSVPAWTLARATQVSLQNMVSCTFAPQCSGAAVLDYMSFNKTLNTLEVENSRSVTNATAPVFLPCWDSDPWICSTNSTWQQRKNSLWPGYGSILDACLAGQCMVVQPYPMGTWAWDPLTQFAVADACDVGLYPPLVLNPLNATINLSKTRWDVPYGGNPCQQIYAQNLDESYYITNVSGLPTTEICSTRVHYNTDLGDWLILPPFIDISADILCEVVPVCAPESSLNCSKFINNHFRYIEQTTTTGGQIAVSIIMGVVGLAIFIMAIIFLAQYAQSNDYCNCRRKSDEQTKLVQPDDFTTEGVEG